MGNRRSQLQNQAKMIILEFRREEFVIPPREKLADRPGRSAHRNTENGNRAL